MFGKSRHKGRHIGGYSLGGPLDGGETTAEADYFDALRRFGHDSAEASSARARWSNLRHRRRHNLAG